MRVADMEVGQRLNCSKHGGWVCLTEYMKRAQTRICPDCQSRAAVEWAKKNRDKKRAANNAYHSRNSGKRAQATAAYRARHPEHRAAHQAVQTAIRNGSLEAKPCSVCGIAKAAAHHDDYGKPLEVVWLCHTHHMERHAMLKEREK